MRRTKALTKLAAALLEAPDGRHWGYDLSCRSGVRSGAMYPRLRQMLELGWLTDGWQASAEVSGRPPRRYYELTDIGRLELTRLL